MTNINFNDSVFNYKSNTGDISINVENNYSDYFDFDKFSKLFSDVLRESDDREERECALDAKQYADKKDKNKLKQLIEANLSTFTTGTFATLAGGILLEMIAKLLNL